MLESDQPVALIVGGNEEVGLACAAALHASGHSVAITYTGVPPENVPFTGVPCDLSSSESVDTAFAQVEDEIGAVNVIVVCAAGIAAGMPLDQMTDDEFLSAVNIHLSGALRVARRSARPMMKARWGRIIFVGSSAGLTGQPGSVDVVAATAGLVGMARSIAKEFATRNITVNVVSVGTLELDATKHPVGGLAAETSRIPMRRAGTAEEVSATVTFLASEAAGYITGAIIPVDGGVSMTV